LSDEEPVEYTLPSDAQFFTVTLSHDSIGKLASISYTIDQLRGEIYNRDSLSYGLESRIRQYNKAIFTYTTAISGGGNVSLIDGNEGSETPTMINSGDSIDVVSFLNNPTKYLRVYAMNGAQKDYTIDLRAHTIDPDSMIYERISDSFPEGKAILWKDTFYVFSKQLNIVNYKDTLYKQTPSGEFFYSSDTVTWTPATLGGDFASGKVEAILGEIKPVPGRPGSLHLLSLIVNVSGTRIFVKTDMHDIWVKGDTVPAGFPSNDFSSVSWIKSNSYLSNLTLIDGASNTVWRTQGDTLSGWSKFTPQMTQGGAFTLPGSSNVFYYDDKLHLMNGNKYDNRIYTSVDGGLTWTEMGNKYLPPVDYKFRKSASVCVKDKFVCVFGGENQNGILPDVWRARLNKLSFEN
jgi:hypothetical protein